MKILEEALWESIKEFKVPILCILVSIIIIVVIAIKMVGLK